MNQLGDRDVIDQNIKEILAKFDDDCMSITCKKGIYIYRSPGCGKTYLMINLLKELEYDVIQYDARDVRNKMLSVGDYVDYESRA
jgi:SpoVK/Ycf46/Vps4 family AAA+-type ATPase